MKSLKSKTTDLTKFKTKVSNLSLNLGLSPFVKFFNPSNARSEKVCLLVASLIALRSLRLWVSYFN